MRGIQGGLPSSGRIKKGIADICEWGLDPQIPTMPKKLVLDKYTKPYLLTARFATVEKTANPAHAAALRRRSRSTDTAGRIIVPELTV